MKRYVVAVCSVLLCCQMLLSCRHTNEIAGRYEEANPISKNFSVALELKNDGKGIWSAGEEVIEIKWETRGRELWLHTKSGGIISGRISRNDSIDIVVPGVGTFGLKKVR